MPLSLTARLLRAARHAYDVTASSVLADTADSQPIGFIGEVDGFVRGIDRIDAALVGETADGIIVAFRGTLPPDSPDHLQAILDWAGDLDAALVADPGGLSGHLHQGFLAAVDDLWPAVEPAVLARSKVNPAKPIYVAGHSKGGPLANIAAMRLRAKLPPPGPAKPGGTPILVATFAGARPGDAIFAAGYDSAIPHSARYEYADDIVPHLPPSDELLSALQNFGRLGARLQSMNRGYASVGELYFIDWSGAIEGDSPLLQLERFVHLGRLITGFDFATIVADHSISLGSGYDKALDS